MKRVPTLILAVGTYIILTSGIIISTHKDAYAYCVHNYTGGIITGEDSMYRSLIGGALGRLAGIWKKTLEPNQRDCCPGDRKECKDRTIYIKPGGYQNPELHRSGSCELKPGDHGLIEVRYKDYKMVCNVI